MSQQGTAFWTMPTNPVAMLPPWTLVKWMGDAALRPALPRSRGCTVRICHEVWQESVSARADTKVWKDSVGRAGESKQHVLST